MCIFCSMKKYIFAILAAVMFVSFLYLSFQNRKEQNSDDVRTEPVFCSADVQECPNGSYVGRVPPDCEFAKCPVSDGDNGPVKGEEWVAFSSDSLEGVDPTFDFSATIPTAWKVSAVPESQAVIFYDPEGSSGTDLDNSQIFVKYFKASAFLTLSTVTIYEREAFEIKGRPAVRYDIEKKPDVANFFGQPKWRNERHFVTDIRSQDASPTIFYVFAKNPELEDEIFEQFLQSVRFTQDASGSSIFFPAKNFTTRITKKSFGTYITPQTSPVQPERFFGFHTGVDVEVENPEEDVSVYAIADGTLVMRQFVSGYGGLVVVKHQFSDDATLYGVYGHVSLESVKKNVSEPVFAGEMIAVLGESESDETDGERKHLHFGLVQSNEIDIRGYVAAAEELGKWIDPLVFFEEKMAMPPPF